MLTTHRRELIAGTVVVMLVACVLLNAIGTLIRNQQYLPLMIADPAVGNVINIVVTLYAIGVVVLGMWLIARPGARFEKLNQRLSIKGVVPGYFWLALFPVGMGLVMIVLTQQTAWGFWLACSSLPVAMLFLIIALRNNNVSK
jgi:hypothetical protein